MSTQPEVAETGNADWDVSKISVHRTTNGFLTEMPPEMWEVLFDTIRHLREAPWRSDEDEPEAAHAS